MGGRTKTRKVGAAGTEGEYVEIEGGTEEVGRQEMAKRK